MQRRKGPVKVPLDLVPVVEGQVAAVDKAADQTVALPAALGHLAEVHAGFEYETVGAGFGQIVDKGGEVAVGTKQHLLARRVHDAPEFGVARDDDPAVDLRIHKGPLGPDEVVVLDQHFGAGLRPGLHKEQCTAEEAVEDSLHFAGVRRAQ